MLGLEIAARSSQRVRAIDRRTQLIEFKPTAERVTGTIAEYVQDNHQAFFERRYSLIGTSAQGRTKVPFDEVGVEFTVQINLNHHSMLRSATYAVGSRGEQCVLMRRDMGRDAENGPIIEKQNWIEVDWFAGTGVANTETAIRNLKGWIGQAIQELERLVAG